MTKYMKHDEYCSDICETHVTFFFSYLNTNTIVLVVVEFVLIITLVCEATRV